MWVVLRMFGSSLVLRLLILVLLLIIRCGVGSMLDCDLYLVKKVFLVVWFCVIEMLEVVGVMKVCVVSVVRFLVEMFLNLVVMVVYSVFSLVSVVLLL